MRFAYADPPYLECAKMYRDHHPEAMIWNDPETHRRLVERLSDEWPDGWALSLHVPSLQTILAFCPTDVRIGAACKVFHQYRPTSVQWAWEPVIWRGGRAIPGRKPFVRDWLSFHIGPRSPTIDGIIGGKPFAFSRWIFDLLGAQRGDTLDDLFPGTGAVGAAWAEFAGTSSSMPLLPLEIEASS